MGCEAGDGGLVECQGLVVEHQRVGVCQAVFEAQGQRARKTLLAIGKNATHFDTGGLVLHSIKHPQAGTLDAAMQAVRAIVDTQGVTRAAEHKTGMANASCITAYECAHRRRTAQHCVQTVVTEHHITRQAVSVRHHKLLDFCTVVSDARHHAVRVAQHIKRNRFAINVSGKQLGHQQGRDR